MNYMPDVAKMLGVALGEEFEIIFPKNPNCHATAILNNERLYIKEYHNIANQDIWQQSALTYLLNGSYTIKHKPWKPKVGDTYYYVNTNGCVAQHTWDDCWMPMNDYLMQIHHYKIGNCYRTPTEAKENHDKWLKFYESDDILEI